MNLNKTFYAIICFYSRIILRKLNKEQQLIYRKLEKIAVIVAAAAASQLLISLYYYYYYYNIPT